MLKITEYVPASQIWPTAEDHVDMGEISGLMRGYNIEVEKNGNVDWMSAEWIYGTPEAIFNDDYHTWSRSDLGLKPTGRICFRGYGVERYDTVEREAFIDLVTDDKAKEIADESHRTKARLEMADEEKIEEMIDTAIQNELRYDKDHITHEGWEFLENCAPDLVMSAIRADFDEDPDDFHVTEDGVEGYLAHIINQYEQTHANIRQY